MKELIIKHAWICIPNDGDIAPVFGNIYIENGIITKIEEVKHKSVGFLRLSSRQALSKPGGEW